MTETMTRTLNLAAAMPAYVSLEQSKALLAKRWAWHQYVFSRSLA